MQFLQKFSWLLFAFLCLAIGFYPLLYLVFGNDFGILSSKSAPLLGSMVWNFSFYAHILLGGLALLIGWIQFIEKIQVQYRKIHKRIGMVYVTAVFFSGIAGIYLGFHATGGIISSLGFILLGVIWLFTTMMGWFEAKKHNYVSHEHWMIFSYAACFAAVTLRLWLPILIALHQGAFLPAYQIVAWLCWVPNMVVAFWLVRRKQNQFSLRGGK